VFSNSLSGKVWLSYDVCEQQNRIRIASCRQHGVFELPVCISYTSDLFTGLRHLHHRLIMHRDIKPSNLLLRHAVSGSFLTICDWGWSRRMELGGVHDRIQNGRPDMTPGVCSEPHRPPEVWAGTGYDLRVDIWPAGIIAAELYTSDSW